MSAYQVNKLCYRVTHEPALLERMKSQPAEALKEFDLTPEERQALLAGEVGRLYQLGAHPYLLGHLAPEGLFGLNRQLYQQRMKALLPKD